MSATPTMPPGATSIEPPATRQGRSFRSALIRQITLWHWVSSGICLGGMLLFTITGITLNHASAIPATPRVTTVHLDTPPPVRAELARGPADGRHPIPPAIHQWLENTVHSTGDGRAEWNPDEVYVSLPRPGGDAWINIERATGKVRYEVTSRGWISYLNDLHKGRHTGTAWSWYIDLLAVACLVFSITGLVLLWTHSAKRPSTWPLVGFSVLSPVLVLIFFLHR